MDWPLMPPSTWAVPSGRNPDRCTVSRSRSWRSAAAHPFLRYSARPPRCRPDRFSTGGRRPRCRGRRWRPAHPPSAAPPLPTGASHPGTARRQAPCRRRPGRLLPLPIPCRARCAWAGCFCPGVVSADSEDAPRATQCTALVARVYLAARGTWPADGPPLPAAVRWLPPSAWEHLPTWPGPDGRPRRLTPPADGIRSLRPDAPPVPRCGALVFELHHPGCAPDAVELEAVTADGRRPAERWRKAPGGASGRTRKCSPTRLIIPGSTSWLP